jgi:hypothetical protein
MDGTLDDDDGTVPPLPIDVRATVQEPDVQETLVEALTEMPEPGATAVIVPGPLPPKQLADAPDGITLPLESWQSALAAVPADKPVNCTLPLTIKDVSVPVLVRDDAVTPEASVPPVSVPAAAVTVHELPRTHPTPLTVVVPPTVQVLPRAQA